MTRINTHSVGVVHGHADTSALIVIDDPFLGLASVLGRERHLETAGPLCDKVGGLVL